MASERDRPHDIPATPRQLCHAFSPVRSAPGPVNKRQTLKFGQLATHGRVVASDQIGELGDTERTTCAERYEQWKKRAVETNPCLTQEGIIALGAVQESNEIDQRPAQLPQIACILHLYSAPREDHIYVYDTCL